jgi:hypothetical protein
MADVDPSPQSVADPNRASGMQHPIIRAGKIHCYQLLIMFIIVLKHALACLIVITGMWVVERFLYELWGTSDRLLFGVLDLSYVFDGGDIIVITAFILLIAKDVYCLFTIDKQLEKYYDNA